eukprot:SAG31_NODE_2825_length_5038_cov_2.170277_5_plen_58_part_00
MTEQLRKDTLAGWKSWQLGRKISAVALQEIIRLVDDDGSGANSYTRVQVNLIEHVCS